MTDHGVGDFGCDGFFDLVWPAWEEFYFDNWHGE